MTPRTVRLTVAAMTPRRDEGADAVCPQCGGPLTHHSDAMGYGVTVEQCERFPQCDYWRTLERRVRPELARRPLVDERKRQRRSPDADRPALIVLLPDGRATGETALVLAARLGRSLPYTKALLKRLIADDRAAVAVQHVIGKTGHPANIYWRCA